MKTRPQTKMSSFQTGVLCILYIIRSSDSSMSDTVRQPLLGVERIQTKDKTVLKVVKPQEHYEYPGNNYIAFRKINKDWNNYYSCLIGEVAKEKERKPIIIQIMEGQFTSMKCNHCPRPFQENANLEWKYKPLTSDIDDPDEPEVLDLTPQMKLSHKMTLKIFNAIVGYAGLYVCYHGNTPNSVYILEIIRDQEMSLFQHPSPSNDTIRAIDGTQLQVYYLWSKWTECSACDSVGKRFRYGTCMVKLEDPISYLLPQYNPTTHGSVETVVQKMNKRYKKIKKSQDYLISQSDSKEVEIAKQILNKFHTGIPCTSELLPNLYKPVIKDLNKTGTVVIVEYCKVACPLSTLFEMFDKQGRIIEIANNTAGIYSSYQVIPKAAPEVERKTMTANFGDDVVIQCPGNLNTDTPVTWRLDEQGLVPELIEEESNGRITIDLLNRLHIRHVRLKDSHVYSCWERDKLAGTVTLNVDKKLVLAYDHHMLLISMLSIALTFIYIGIKVLTREIKLRKRLTT